MCTLKAHHAPERVLDSLGRMSHIVDRAKTCGLRDGDQESEDVGRLWGTVPDEVDCVDLGKGQGKLDFRLGLV